MCQKSDTSRAEYFSTELLHKKINRVKDVATAKEIAKQCDQKKNRQVSIKVAQK